MMKKKLFTIGGAILLSGTVMLTSAFSSFASTSSGYETLKSAMKNSVQVENATMQADLSVKDNDSSVIQIQSTFKSDIKQNMNSGVMILDQDDEDITFELFNDTEQMVIKSSNSDTYYVMPIEDVDADEEKNNDSDEQDLILSQEVEQIIDVLVGRYKSSFELITQDDGTQIVDLSLDKEEIPVMLNAVGSAIIRNNEVDQDEVSEDELANVHPLSAGIQAVSLPELTDDIYMNHIQFKTVINNEEQIEDMLLILQFNGKDTSGEEHLVEFNLHLTISDINQTSVDIIQLEGKTVEILSNEE